MFYAQTNFFTVLSKLQEIWYSDNSSVGRLCVDRITNSPPAKRYANNQIKMLVKILSTAKVKIL